MKPRFNRKQFYQRLARLLRIVLPSIYSKVRVCRTNLVHCLTWLVPKMSAFSWKEAAILGMHTFFLFFRTLLSIYVAYIDGCYHFVLCTR